MAGRLDAKIEFSAVDNVSAAVDRMGNKLAPFNKKLDLLSNAAGAMGAIFASNAGVDMFAASMRPAIEFEEAMANVNKALGKSDEDLDDLARRLRSVAVESRVAHSEIAELAENLGAAGITDNEALEKAAGFASKMAVAFDLSGQSAGESYAAIRSQLGKSDEEAMRFLNTTNLLSNRLAAAPEKLIAFSKGSLGLMTTAKLAAAEIQGMGGFLLDLGIQADVAKTGVNKVFSRLSSGEAPSKDAAAMLKLVGTSARELSEDVVANGGLDTMNKLFLKLNQLSEVDRTKFITTYFGEEGKNAVTQMITKTEQLAEAIAIANDEAAQQGVGSVADEFAGKSNTTAAAIRGLDVAVQDFYISVGGANNTAFGKIINFLADLVSGVTDYMDVHPTFSKYAVTFGQILIGVGTAAAVAGIGVNFLSVGLLVVAAKVALVVGGVAALGVGLYALYENWDEISTWFVETWDYLLAGVTAGVEAVSGVFSEWWSWLSDGFSYIWDMIPKGLENALSFAKKILIDYNPAVLLGRAVASGAKAAADFVGGGGGASGDPSLPDPVGKSADAGAAVLKIDVNAKVTNDGVLMDVVTPQGAGATAGAPFKRNTGAQGS